MTGGADVLRDRGLLRSYHSIAPSPLGPFNLLSSRCSDTNVVRLQGLRALHRAVPATSFEHGEGCLRSGGGPGKNRRYRARGDLQASAVTASASLGANVALHESALTAAAASRAMPRRR